MRQVHRVRRQPARHDQPDRRRACTGLPARAQLRAARRRDRPGARRAAPPRRADLRSAGRRHDRRRSSSASSRRCRRRTNRWRTRPRRRQRLMPGARRRTPEALLQRLEWTVLRRLDGALQGDYRTLFRGHGLDLADLREYQLHDDVRHIDWNVTARLQIAARARIPEDREVAPGSCSTCRRRSTSARSERKREVSEAFVAVMASVVLAPRQPRRRGALRQRGRHRAAGQAAGRMSRAAHDAAHARAQRGARPPARRAWPS